MQEITYTTGNYTLILSERERKGKRELTVEMHRGRGASLNIPERVEVEGEMLPVTAIAKKAFLGNRSLREVTLPATVRKLSDWAFAQCEALSMITSLREKPLKIARNAFDDCKSLTDICTGGQAAGGFSKLIAACPARLSAGYLLAGAELGSAGWYANWDTRLSAFLDEDDEEGYTNVVLCGEEDIDASVPEFVKEKRRNKCALCFMRLMEDTELNQEYRAKFTGYVLERVKGSATEEAWEVIMTEFADRPEYYELLARLGGITRENTDAMIAELSEQHAETKAWLIRYKQEHFAEDDVFDQFVL